MRQSTLLALLVLASPFLYLTLIQLPLAHGENHASISSHLNYLHFEDGSARFNPDGSFYRGDEFSITVSYSLASDVVSHSLEWTYDISVLTIVRFDGPAIFKILPNADYGAQTVTARLSYVWRYYTSEPYACGPYGNETCWRQVPHDVPEFVTSSQTIVITPYPTINLSSGIVNVRNIFGLWRNNSDGTYYRGDGLKVVFESSQIWRNIAYFTVESHVDLKAFERTDLNRNRFDPNPDTNRLYRFKGSFEYNITSSANPQTHRIVLKAYGYDSSGNLLTMGSSSLSVTVVEYDPHFSNPLTYTYYKGMGSTAYEKPFVVLVKYLGNGPTYNVGQRAVITSYRYGVNALNLTYVKDRCLQSKYTDCYNITYIRQPSASINWLNQTQLPIVVQGEENYARLLFNMPSISIREILSQNHTIIRVETTLYTDRFFYQGMKPLLQSTYIYEPLAYQQPVEVMAVRPKDGGWVPDPEVHLSLNVNPVGDKTFNDTLKEWAQGQTNDAEALSIFSQDLYSNDLQSASGIGVLNIDVNRTTNLSYEVTITATGYGRSKAVTAILTPSFTNELVRVYVNMVGGGLTIDDVVDYPYATMLYLNIASESGGVKWIAFTDDRGRVLQNSTLAEIQNPSSITPGYVGSWRATYLKSERNLSQISLQYGNAWGAVSTIRDVAIQPYKGESLQTALRFDQLAYGLGILLVLAIGMALMGLSKSR